MTTKKIPSPEAIKRMVDAAAAQGEVTLLYQTAYRGWTDPDSWQFTCAVYCQLLGLAEMVRSPFATQLTLDDI